VVRQSVEGGRGAVFCFRRVALPFIFLDECMKKLPNSKGESLGKEGNTYFLRNSPFCWLKREKTATTTDPKFSHA
jgi:hypothetical protein